MKVLYHQTSQRQDPIILQINIITLTHIHLQVAATLFYLILFGISFKTREYIKAAYSIYIYRES